MISLVNKDWLNKEFCNSTIQPMETFVGAGFDISLKAANNTDVNIEGAVTLNFVVPFIVTKEELSNPILGFNVIELLIQNSVLTKDHTVSDNIFPSFQD